MESRSTYKTELKKTYRHINDSLGTKNVENVKFFSIFCNFSWLILIYFWEIHPVFFQNLRWHLARKFFKDFIDFPLLSWKNFKLLRLNNPLILWALTKKSFKESSPFFNKSSFFISNNLFFWNSRNVATRPSLAKRNFQCEEFIVASLNFKPTLRILSGDSVLNNTANF